MITMADLNWWLDLETELDWQFATTYAEGAPHEYVLADKTPGITAADTARAAHVIRTFGEPMKFYNSTRIYLTTPQGWKHWDMQGGRISDADVSLINRGRIEHVYGVQNAPRTASGAPTPYDAMATRWDTQYPLSLDEQAETVALIRGTFGEKLWRTLDVGCGTGWPLDLGLADPVRYVGVDPSTAMLNALVMKHPHLASLHPMTFETAEKRRVLGGTRFDTVLALGGAASYLSADDLRALVTRAKRASVFAVYADGERPPTGDLSDEELDAARRRVQEVAGAASVTQRIGRFETTIVSSV